MIRKILFVIAGLIVLLLLVGFVLPANLNITKSYTINAPAPSVFEEVNDLERWQGWQYWNTLDPDVKITYGEKKAGTGASYSWDGPVLDKGTITITESIPDKSIAIDLNFGGNPAKGFYSIESEGDNTKLNLNFTNDVGMNPIGRWFNVYMKGEIEKSFDYAGDRIKSLAEAKPKFGYQIHEENVSSLSYVGLLHTMSPKDPAAISTQMAKMYGELETVLKKANVTMTGHPFCLYPKYSEESMDMICAMPVSSDAKLPAKHKVMQTDSGLTVKGVLKGDYNNLQNVHTEIQKYIQYKKLTESGAPWEVYVTDPMVEKDTVRWVTEVYYPVNRK